MKGTIICKNCKQEKKHRSLGLCQRCYYQQYSRKIIICKLCKKEKEQHAFGLCHDCYAKERWKIPEVRKKKFESKQTVKYKEYNKEYNQREDVKQKKKEYALRPESKLKRQIHSKEYYQRPEVRERMRTWHRERQRWRRQNDESFLIRMRLRENFRQALKNYSKNGKIKTSKRYGIDYQVIIEYLGSCPGDIKNYNIHHKKLLSSFDLNDSEQIKEAFAPSNHEWVTIEKHKNIHSKRY